MKNRFLPALTLVISLIAGAIDLDDSGNFTMTGFYNIVGGDVISGSANASGLSYSNWQYQQWHCPCTIQNWEYVGVYQKNQDLQFDQESLLGIQLKAKFNDNLSATAQLVSRPDNTAYHAYTPTVDWAYLSWQPDQDSPWTFQIGRKRIPLYYYSDYLYIGYAYPWIRPAADVYGWPIYAYNGINAGYERQLGGSNWTMTANMWFGSYSQSNDAYDTLIYTFNPATGLPTGSGQAHTDESWNGIAGAWLDFSNGIFEVRGMMMRYRDSTTEFAPGAAPTQWVTNQFTRIEGLAANLDYAHWVVRTEFDRYQQINPGNFQNIYTYYLAGVGYKIGEFTPMITQSHYTTNPLSGAIEARTTDNIVLRWDFHKNMAFKVQYDVSKDKSTYPYPFFGDSNLLSIALEGVF